MLVMSPCPRILWGVGLNDRLLTRHRLLLLHHVLAQNNEERSLMNVEAGAGPAKRRIELILSEVHQQLGHGFN